MNRLETLNLRVNSLRGLTRGVFTGLTDLRVLMLGGNALDPLPADIFTDLSTLEYLELWGNDLNSLPSSIFNGLDSLRLLGLSKNSLTSLPGGVFDGLGSLQSLSLGENDLIALSKNAIEDLSVLRSLGLSKNDLDTLPIGILDEFLDTLGKPVDPVITRNTIATVAVLPHVIAGPLGESIARTELAITHRDPRMAGCEVAVLFHNGTTEAPAVAFNGRFPVLNHDICCHAVERTDRFQ